MADVQVLVLGGGISGCLTACLLADSGIDVAIVDQHDELMSGASLWNEGKIHLGYTYVGTPSVATAALMQEGAAVFEEVIQRVTGEAIPEIFYSAPVVYLVDEASMFDAELLWNRCRVVVDLLRANSGSRPGLRRYAEQSSVLERLEVAQAEAETGQTGFTAAWRTAERAIAPRLLAERIRAAVAARPIHALKGRVLAAEARPTGWRIAMDTGHHAAAPVVVNCLWEGRPSLDRTVRPSNEPVSIRYKRSLFGHRVPHLGRFAPSTRVLGQYGDITPYANGDAYLSWYPAGLAARSDDGTPPVVPDVRDDLLIRDTLQGLRLEPRIVEADRGRWEVNGGYIVARGHGDVDHVASPLHDRHYPDVQELVPGFFSVDTGKYSLGSLMATRAARMVLARLRPAVHVAR